jgi:hypothetical protein
MTDVEANIPTTFATALAKAETALALLAAAVTPSDIPEMVFPTALHASEDEAEAARKILAGDGRKTRSSRNLDGLRAVPVVTLAIGRAVAFCEACQSRANQRIERATSNTWLTRRTPAMVETEKAIIEDEKQRAIRAGCLAMDLAVGADWKAAEAAAFFLAAERLQLAVGFLNGFEAQGADEASAKAAFDARINRLGANPRNVDFAELLLDARWQEAA